MPRPRAPAAARKAGGSVSRIPLPALMLIATFACSTATWALHRWISMLSGYAIEPATLCFFMTISACCGAAAAGISRSR